MMFRTARGVLLLAICGCALTSKSEPMHPRFFAADYAFDEPKQRLGRGIRVRLGRVTSADYLRQKMVFRRSAYELGYHEEDRWTERPEAYLERMLTRALFEVHGFERAVSGASPTLDAQLLAFEEWQSAPRRAHVEVKISLYDDGASRSEKTLTFEQPILPDQDADAVARALSVALGRAVTAVATDLSQTLARGASDPCSAAPLRSTAALPRAKVDAAP